MSSYTAKAALRLSGLLRSVGSTLDGLGKNIEVTKYTEKLVPSTRFVAVDGIGPTVSEMSFVAPSASVIGDVTIGKESSVWYGAVIRGDVNKVTVGSKTSIGDRAVVHVAKIQGDYPTNIGNNVTISAGAVVHAATIHDNVIIGEMAQVLDGAVIESNSIIEPAAIVTPRTHIPSGELWSGTPAKKVRTLTAEEINAITATAYDTVVLASEHAIESAKSFDQIREEAEVADIEQYIDPHAPKQPPVDISDILGQGHPGRIFRSSLTHPEQAAAEASKQSKQ